MAYAHEGDIAARLRAETRPLLAWLLVLTGNRDVADELFQEVCLEVWRGRARFREGEEFGAWVRGVAKNVVLRERRRRGRDRVTPWSPELLEGFATSRPSHSSPHGEDDRRLALEACLEELGPQHRDVLRRIYHDRAPHAVIAKESGRSASAVKMLAMRLRTRLKDCVSRRLQEEELDVL